MAKLDWAGLEVVESWPATGPSTTSSSTPESESIQILSELILKAFTRAKLAQAKRLKKPTLIPDENGGE